LHHTDSYTIKKLTIIRRRGFDSRLRQVPRKKNDTFNQTQTLKFLTELLDRKFSTLYILTVVLCCIQNVEQHFFIELKKVWQNLIKIEWQSVFFCRRSQVQTLYRNENETLCSSKKNYHETYLEQVLLNQFLFNF